MNFLTTKIFGKSKPIVDNTKLKQDTRVCDTYMTDYKKQFNDSKYDEVTISIDNEFGLPKNIMLYINRNPNNDIDDYMKTLNAKIDDNTREIEKKNKLIKELTRDDQRHDKHDSILAKLKEDKENLNSALKFLTSSDYKDKVQKYKDEINTNPLIFKINKLKTTIDNECKKPIQTITEIKNYHKYIKYKTKYLNLI